MRGGADNPTCVITFGPTGAGKSHLHESAIRALHRKNILKDVGDEENWVMILIDDIVAGNGDDKKPSESYKKKSKRYIY